MSELATIKPRALAQVVRWIVAGHDAATIAEAIEAQYPGEKPQPLQARALKELTKSARPDPEVIRGWAVEALQQIYRNAIEDRDHGAAMKAVRMLLELTK